MRKIYEKIMLVSMMLMVVFCFNMFGSILVVIIFGILGIELDVMTFFSTSILGMCIFGIIYLILLFTSSIFFPEKKSKVIVNAERFKLKFTSYNKLHHFLEDKLVTKGYKLYDNINDKVGINTELYIKKGKDQVHCISINKLEKLNNKKLNILSDIHDYFLEEYINDFFVGYTYFITIIIVDRKNLFFNNYINSEIEDIYKLSKLPVGISMGGKTIYISKGNNILSSNHYKKLRKEFLNLMDLEEYQNN